MLSAPLRRRAAIAMVAAAGIAIMTGCAATSPAIITEPYLAADGTDADLALDDGTNLALRNFVVVLDEKGGAGQVLGAVAFSGSGSQPLAIAATDAAQVPAAAAADDQPTQEGSAAGAAPGVVLDVEGGELAQVGPEGTPFILPVVNVAPGQYVQLTASSPVTGKVTWAVPVVAPTHYYAGLAATVTTAASPSTTATTKPTATETSSD